MPIGSLRPQIPLAVKKLRLGVLAVSSYVLPVYELGSPPKPSITSKTILVGEERAISFINSKLLVITNLTPLRIGEVPQESYDTTNDALMPAVLPGQKWRVSGYAETVGGTVSPYRAVLGIRSDGSAIELGYFQGTGPGFKEVTIPQGVVKLRIFRGFSSDRAYGTVFFADDRWELISG